MAFRAADLIKRHIVQVNTGLIVGHVEDLVINPDPQQVVALVTISPRWKREATVIPWSQVRVASGDVILVEAGSEPEPISVYPELQALIERRIRLNGTPVISEAGTRYGSVHDLLLEEDGLIIGYILSYGFLGADRRYVAAGAVKAIGPDAIVAMDGALRELGDAHQPTSPRLILPFTGTPISLDEIDEIETMEPPTTLIGLPEPAEPPPIHLTSPNEILGDIPDAAVVEGEALVVHPPVEPPPVTSQSSAGEMLLAVDAVAIDADAALAAVEGQSPPNEDKVSPDPTTIHTQPSISGDLSEEMPAHHKETSGDSTDQQAPLTERNSLPSEDHPSDAKHRRRR